MIKKPLSPPSDPQQQLVYSWQRAFVDEKVANVVMSRAETVELTIRACGLLGIPEPRIRFLQLNVSCRADLRRNVIEIADWGRTKPVLLHEIAHLATIPDILAGDHPHGRAFVSMAIALFARFIPLPIDALVEDAKFMGVDMDEKRARGPIGRERETSFFPGDI